MAESQYVSVRSAETLEGTGEETSSQPIDNAQLSSPTTPAESSPVDSSFTDSPDCHKKDEVAIEMTALPSQPTDSSIAQSKNNLSIHGTAPLYEVLTPQEKKYILWSVYLARFLAVLDGTIVSVALPAILDNLGGTQYLAWLIASYLLSSAVAMPLSGRLSDLYGRKIVYIISLIIFLISSALCGAATDIWFLIVARFLQGFGGGGLTGLTMIIPGDVCAPAERAHIFGVMGMISGLGALLGPIIGGGLTDAYSWRLIFYINLPPGAVSLALAFVSMKRFETSTQKLAMDYLGGFLISASTICLLLFIFWGGDDQIGYPWDSAQIIFLICFFAITLILFLYQETRHPLPILDLGIHRIKNVWINMVIISLAYYGMVSVGNYMAIYFQNVVGDKAVISGLKQGGFVFGFMLSSSFSGPLLNKTSRPNVAMFISGCIMALGIGLMALISPTMNYGIIFAFTTIMGLGIGYLIVATGAMVQNAVPQKDIAVAMSNFSFDSYIGGCIGVTVCGTVFNRTLSNALNNGHNITDATCKGIDAVFLWSVPVILLAAVLGLFLDPMTKKVEANNEDKETLKAKENGQMERETLQKLFTSTDKLDSDSTTEKPEHADQQTGSSTKITYSPKKQRPSES